ncbi:hypothetical protein EMIT043CA1_20347 [Pseudomonas brassicacearum]
MRGVASVVAPARGNNPVYAPFITPFALVMAFSRGCV